MEKSMKAAVTTKPGSPEVIELLEKSIPSAKKGWVLIKIKAFGLNRVVALIHTAVFDPKLPFALDSSMGS